MPSKSKSQQRLFSMALAVRKGDLKRSEVHQSVLKMLSSITKNASPVNTNTVANDLNEAAAANAILENQVAADNAIPNQNANQGQAADPNQQVQQQQEQQQQQAQQQAQPVAQ